MTAIRVDPMRIVTLVGKYGFMALGGFLTLLPFYWMAGGSLMTTQEITSRPMDWYPHTPKWNNYEALAEAIPVARMYLNSAIVTASVLVGILFTSSLAGYGFAKFRFPGRDKLFLMVLATMMVPFFVVLIPVLYIVRTFGWVDSYMGLIVPNLVTAFGIFLMRQNMLGIPDELIDAARIDGSSEFGTYWRIVVPLVRPALGALAVITFVFTWNSFLWPLVVLRSRDLFTVPIGLNLLQQYFATEEAIPLQLAGATLSSVPVIAVFAFLQRYFVQGLALTGIKG